MKIFPAMELRCVEDPTLVAPVVRGDSGVEGIRTASMYFPANATETDKEYTVVLYANGTATALTKTITVVGTSTVLEYYQASSLKANKDVLPATGDTVEFSIEFNLAE